MLGATVSGAAHGEIRHLAPGDAEALARLYDRYARTVFSLALHIVGDQADAEDVVQEVFSQAWTQARRYDPKRGTVAAWLFTIARSRALDRLRARRARPDVDPVSRSQVQDIADPAGPHEVDLLGRDQVRRLRDVMAGLPVQQRVVVELAYFEGLTQQEIAARLEEPLGTVKTRARLALRKLREAVVGSRT